MDPSSCALPDEGISDVMLEPPSASAAAAAAANFLGDCCSSSEGYATSQGSLTSSETISPASEVENNTEEEAPPMTNNLSSLELEEALQIDSLTLALEELRSERVASVPPPPPPLLPPRGAKPSGRCKPSQQRSSSMKSQKTPPGTPNQMKKVVRFADAFGLDLAYVRHVFDTDNPPVIPPQATRDLNLGDWGTADRSAVTLGLRGESPRIAGGSSQLPEQMRRLFISPCFAQPGSCANFFSRVLALKVVLERASVNSTSGQIDGVVRVANIGFEKSVLIRITFDAWRSSQDVQASYVTNSSSGTTDQFAFSLPLPAQFGVGDRAVFCVRFCARGETYWDNNFGDNYSFDCFAVNKNCDAAGPAWTHFL